jgi:hypothetical protein
MKRETFEAVAESAYGKKLETPIKYAGTFEAYESFSEVVSANDLLKEKEVVDFRNTQKKANARQKALQAALDAAGIVKPTLENDDQLKLKKMYEIFIAAKNTHDEARTKAAAALNLEWID